MDVRPFSDFAGKLAAAAGDIIRPLFRSMQLDTSLKEDRSIVTQADRQAESVMRDLILERFPDHGIAGEEYGIVNPGAEFVWTLDPIDGTITFAAGCPLFGTMIALLQGGVPVLGVISNPILDEICLGTAEGTTLNGVEVRLRECDKLSEATLLTTDMESIWRRHNRERFEILLAKTRMFRTWGDCYGYLLLASGYADIMLDSKLSVWDMMPLIPIVRGAGGTITTWSGADPLEGGSCVAAAKNLHPQIIEILKT